MAVGEKQVDFPHRFANQTLAGCNDTRAGVDWLIDDSDAPHYRFTTFGRSPAVEVYLDYDEVSGSQVLTDLGPAVGQLPTTGATCTNRPAS